MACMDSTARVQAVREPDWPGHRMPGVSGRKRHAVRSLERFLKGWRRMPL